MKQKVISFSYVGRMSRIAPFSWYLIRGAFEETILYSFMFQTILLHPGQSVPKEEIGN